MQSLASERIVLLNTVTSGTSIPIEVQGRDEVTIYFTSTGTTSGGTLLIEEADYDPNQEPVYGGTWSQIASVAASGFTGGAQQAYHISPTSYTAVRVRISSTISGGGTVKVTARIA